MIVGFTGTREGMTPVQKTRVKGIVRRMMDAGTLKEVHHGDCIGADAEFHDICRELGVPRIVIHPPTNDKYRAFCKGGVVLEPREYLVRNKAIVNSSNVLLGTPKEREEPAPARGQGTWSTIRYARSSPLKPGVLVVLPQGKYLRQKGR